MTHDSLATSIPTRQSGCGTPSDEHGHDHRRRAARRDRKLDVYMDTSNRTREVFARQASAGSVLVIDRDVATRGDTRLVAHLGADEPSENAALVCADYLRDDQVGLRLCRRVSAEDARTTPFAEHSELDGLVGCSRPEALVDQWGCSYRLKRLQTGMSIPELRWCRSASGDGELAEVVSLREVIARLQSYEPMCALTREAVAREAARGGVSVTVLRAELTRVLESPIVLNRALREAVMRRVERDQLSMSEIAIRCGRVKRDGRGNVSGETSWLARRIGLLSEAGQRAPTPWLHSDVLALIARRGLGISPREVEL